MASIKRVLIRLYIFRSTQFRIRKAAGAIMRRCPHNIHPLSCTKVKQPSRQKDQLQMGPVNQQRPVAHLEAPNLIDWRI